MFENLDFLEVHQIFSLMIYQQIKQQSKDYFNYWIQIKMAQFQQIKLVIISCLLNQKINGFLSQTMVPFEFEELYQTLKEDPQEEYFITLRLISQIFDIPKIKVLL